MSARIHPAAFVDPAARLGADVEIGPGAVIGPHVTIRDWPDMPWRCLSPQMTWYSGYNRLEGYDHATAVVIARRLEQLLRCERGFFAPELREAGVTEAEEREAEARLAAAAAARQEAGSARRR